jgi:hypothetical protein
METKDLENAVRAIAQQKGKEPANFREEEGEIVILWEDGSKDHYKQEQSEPMINTIKSAPSAPSTEPLISAPPKVVAKPKKEKGGKPK